MVNVLTSVAWASVVTSWIAFIYYVRTNSRISDPLTNPVRTNYDVTMTTILTVGVRMALDPPIPLRCVRNK